MLHGTSCSPASSRSSSFRAPWLRRCCNYRAAFPSACLLFPDAAPTLLALRASGRKLGLITNGSVRMQSAKLACLALSPMFDTILISDAEGITKPERQIFHRALERLSVNPA